MNIENLVVGIKRDKKSKCQYWWPYYEQYSYRDQGEIDSGRTCCGDCTYLSFPEYVFKPSAQS